MNMIPRWLANLVERETWEFFESPDQQYEENLHQENLRQQNLRQQQLQEQLYQEREQEAEEQRRQETKELLRQEARMYSQDGEWLLAITLFGEIAKQIALCRISTVTSLETNKGNQAPAIRLSLSALQRLWLVACASPHI